MTDDLYPDQGVLGIFVANDPKLEETLTGNQKHLREEIFQAEILELKCVLKLQGAIEFKIYNKIVTVD